MSSVLYSDVSIYLHIPKIAIVLFAKYKNSLSSMQMKYKTDCIKYSADTNIKIAIPTGQAIARYTKEYTKPGSGPQNL